MAKKGILHETGVGKGRLKGMMWGVALLCYSLLSNPQHAGAEMCTEIDYNKPTIAAGAYHTVGIKEDGTVVAMASINYYGAVNVSDWTNIKAVAAGAFHTVGLKEDGTVVAEGWNVDNVSSWLNIKAIAAGPSHTVGLREDGTVVAAGSNWYGQLNVSSWRNIKAIAAGGAHTVGLKEDGTVVAVGAQGWSDYGQLNVSGWRNIKAIAAGGWHTIGLKEDGTVVAVGQNWFGKLNVSDWINIKAVAAGSHHTVGLKEDGTVVAVGEGSRGNLQVSDWSNITAIAATTYVTIGLKEDGTVVATEYYTLDQSGYMYEYLKYLNWTNIRQPVCRDDLPPIVNLYVSPNILWPPDHKMLDVWIGGDATDTESGIASVEFSVTDEYGIIQPSISNFDTTIQLEAWRDGTDKDGRHYTITVVATDATGNKTTTSTTVLVPHDQGNK